MYLIEFARFTHNGRVTKIRTRCVRNMHMYVITYRWRPWRVPVIALQWRQNQIMIWGAGTARRKILPN